MCKEWGCGAEGIGGYQIVEPQTELPASHAVRLIVGVLTAIPSSCIACIKNELRGTDCLDEVLNGLLD